jgi:hypothetical protein
VYTIRKSIQSHSTILAILFAAALMGTATGCGDASSAEPDPPVARVIYLNEITQLPSLDVYANGQGPTTILLGELTNEVEIATGPTRFALTAPGSTEALIDETLDLDSQLYLLTFTGEITDLALWAVDQAAPELSAGQAAAEVVNLYNGGLTFDVYLDDEPLATALGTRQVSAFSVTTPRTTGTIQVFNAGDDPANALPVAMLETALDDRQSLMVLMKNAATGNGIVLDTLVVR